MKNRMIAMAVALTLALVVAACGTDSTAESTTTSAAGQATTSEAMETATTEAMQDPTTTESMDTTTTEAMAGDTVADIVAGDERFTTLLAAVQAAGLAETLADPEATFTVFAPTNDAFAAALDSLAMTADDLLSAPDLADILTYHVLPEVVTAADILAAGSETVVVDTVEGEPLTITISDSGEVRFLDSGGMVIEADVMASNGVIHVIDAVLFPPSLSS